MWLTAAVNSLNFNPRSLAGATLVDAWAASEYDIFQSTLPRGSDGHAGHGCCRWSDFNPRSLAGATRVSAPNQIMTAISIHAPSRERLSFEHQMSMPAPFQSTLPRGSDRLIAFTHRCTKHFNPRSLAGATIQERYAPLYYTISIHAPSRERRITLSCSNGSMCHFNPRSLAGATTV